MIGFAIVTAPLQTPCTNGPATAGDTGTEDSTANVAFGTWFVWWIKGLFRLDHLSGSPKPLSVRAKSVRAAPTGVDRQMPSDE